jgi:AraC-like DNA-binding protein
MVKDYSKWDCKKVFLECDNVICGLGKIRCRQISTSSDLAEKINGSVRKTINYIYTEIAAQLINPKFDLSRFETSVICSKINLPPNKTRWLENEFRKETGTTIGHFFNDIQMLAALKLYAVTEAPRRDKEKERKAKEKEMVKALENPTLTGKERERIGKLLEETPKGTFLTQIAKSLGFGKLDNFDKRIKSRLGISLSDLRGQSDFFSCEEETDS